MKKKQKTNSFNANADIVSFPNHIKNYDSSRADYSKLCELAINQNYKTFLLISDNVCNYKQLGIKAINRNPFLVLDLSKDNKYYYFFWKLAIFICYKILEFIDEERKELFPIIEKTIEQEPLAIYFVNSNISIYNKLCNIAYKKNKESVKYMDINHVDKNLILEIIKKEPEKIIDLDKNNDYYKNACKIALTLNGKLIKYFKSNEDNLDSFFELVNVAEESLPEVINYPNVIYALCIDNRQRKKRILSTPNILGKNVFKLLKEVDSEYEVLSKKYIESLNNETSKNQKSNFNSDCPIKRKKK